MASVFDGNRMDSRFQEELSNYGQRLAPEDQEKFDRLKPIIPTLRHLFTLGYVRGYTEAVERFLEDGGIKGGFYELDKRGEDGERARSSEGGDASDHAADGVPGAGEAS